jgi:hypothetical protein
MNTSNVPAVAGVNCSNVVVLRGIVGTSIVERELPAGGVALQFDVRTEVSSVNASWIDPPGDANAIIGPGEEVLVVGTVERRFFRVAGSTQSRTEVVTSKVVPVRRSRSVRAAIAAVTRSLGD